ncbi:exodeoxyribonuclease V subunit alpha [Rubrivirga marina]|uniref:Exodeoxyribonuclease V subunit alpha n=1 Tax=Rubrivirga marina TaxID=1196024 RepID=A0A271IZ81_9BACT|nr:exodeoxyribonuclease V subunit alpha [Rubrivirga marina]PAP76288.1 exodeoxyribonuclease V subunit alpha [Rubrivirga marina]
MRSLPIRVTEALDRIAEAEAAAPVDLALARAIAGLDAERGTPDERRAETLALSVALVSRARRDGHSAVALAEHAGRPFPEDEHARAVFRRLPSFPDLNTWHAHLDASPAAGGAEAACPLVFTRDADGGNVAMRRFVDAERRVADAVHTRLGTVTEEVTPDVREAFGRLFLPRADGGLDRQALAAVAALRQRVLFVAGGPGTGKTYTATRILALLRAAHPGLRIALAAPTGKAAARLTESLTAGAAGLPGDLAGAPTEAVTLHRLLGAHPERSGFRHHAKNPLVHDLVLVDEGSMVDLPLFDALLAALRPEARLVVLGDPDQLPPVEVGTAFADLCDAGAGDPPPAFTTFCDALGLSGIPPNSDASPLASSVVVLTESRRFTADSDVGVFAVAVRDGEAEAALTSLHERPGLGLTTEKVAGRAVGWAVPFAQAVVAAASPIEAHALLERFRLLAAVRRGPRGVEGANEGVEWALRESGHVSWSPYGERFYGGRPLLVTVNDRDTGLANGDVGVCWRDEGQKVVVFPDGKSVSLHRLPPHEPAWALTVHKSQGSEFDAVGVVLPEPGTRGAGLVTRELLYTAATRAKTSVHVFGEAAEVESAIRKPQRRASGLGDRLRAALSASAQSVG